MSPYQAIANAVVEQAAKDYRQALLKQKKEPNMPEHAARVRDLERFFRSDWYGVLTGLDGECLMASMRGMVRKEERK